MDTPWPPTWWFLQACPQTRCRPVLGGLAQVLVWLGLALASLAAQGQGAPYPSPAYTTGSCDGHANYADELQASGFRIVSQTDQGDGTSSLQISFMLQNTAIGVFSNASVTPDLAALKARYGVNSDAVVPATFSPIASRAAAALPFSDLVIRLPTPYITDLLAQMNAGSMPMTVHAREVAIPVPGYEVIHWTGTEDALFALAEQFFGGVALKPPPYAPNEEFTFVLLWPKAGAPASIFDTWAPGKKIYLTEVASQYAVQHVPEILRGGLVTDVDKKEGDQSNPATTWTVTIRRTLNENLPSLFESASFCSGKLAHVDDPVHASRLYSLDGQAQPEAKRDKRGQPLRFNDLRIGDNLTISGQVQGHILKPDLEIRLRRGVPRVLATFDTDLTLSAEARALGDWADKGEAFLYKLCFPIASLPAGPITVNLNLQLEQQVGFEGQLSAEAVMSVQKRFHSRTHVGFDGRLTGDARFLSGSQDLSPPMDFTPPQLTDETQASGRLYTRLRPTLRLGAAYPDCETGAGAYAELKAYGSLDVTPTQTPWWTLGAGLTLQAGLNISAWGLEVANWETQPKTLIGAQFRDSSGVPLLPTASNGRVPPLRARTGLQQAADSGGRTSGADQRWAVAIDDLDSVGGFAVTSVAVTADQGAVVVSHERVGGRSRLMRLNKHGALLWSKRYSTALSVKKVMVLPDDSLLVAGSPNWLARHDAGGNEIRNLSFQVAPPGSSPLAGCSIRDAALLPTPAGGLDVVMVGETANDLVPRACAQRVDAQGNLVWAKGYDGINLQRFNAVLVASDGRMAVAGRWDGITPVPPFGDLPKPAAFIGKLDAATGQVVWGKRLSDTLYRAGEFFDLAESADGTLLAVGNLLGVVTQDGGALLARIAADGSDARHALLTHDFDWEAELAYETPAPLNIGYFDLYDSLYAITPMADGFAVAGRTRLATADQGEGAWLLKLNAQLGVEWFSTLEGPSNDSFDAIAYTGDSLLVTGWSSSLAGLGQSAGDSWLMVAKYPVNGRLQLLPELKGLNMRHLQPGVRDSGNDPLVANPGVVLDVAASVQDLEVRAVTSLASVFTTPSRLCATKMTAQGAVSTGDACLSDTDADAVDDGLDNCLGLANPDQRDTDGDGYGNRCDADLDNNGIVNTLDLSVLRAAFGQRGDKLNADLNGDGVVNTSDLAIFKSLFGKPPGPSGRR